MIYSKYNIFNPLTKHRVHNRCALPLLHLVAWRGDAAALALVRGLADQPNAWLCYKSARLSVIRRK